MVLSLLGILLFSACEKEEETLCAECESDTTSTGVGSGGSGGSGGSTGGAGSSNALDDTAAPEVGVGPSFSNITKNGFTVSWAAATDNRTADADLEYKLVSAASTTALATLDLAVAVTGADVALDWAKATLSHAITERLPLETMAYAVLVRDAAGNVALYPSQDVTTLDGDAPAIGTAISFSLVSHEYFSIHWVAASSSMSPQNKLRYRVVIAESAAAIDSITEAEAMSGTSVVLAYTENQLATSAVGLDFGTVYFVSVLVKDEQGRTSIYTPASVETSHHRLIFATGTEHDASFLGTVADVDAVCEAAKPSNRTASFKALYAGSVRTACTNPYCNPIVNGDLNDWPLRASTAYESVDGDLIFTTQHLGIVAAGATIKQVDALDARTWTGLNANWTYSNNNCQHWTSVASNLKGDGGWSTNTSSAVWSGYDWNCNYPKKVFCVEQ